MAYHSMIAFLYKSNIYLGFHIYPCAALQENGIINIIASNGGQNEIPINSEDPQWSLYPSL